MYVGVVSQIGWCFQFTKLKILSWRLVFNLALEMSSERKCIAISLSYSFAAQLEKSLNR